VLSQAPRHEDVWRSGSIASRTGRFTPQEKAHGYPLDRDWLGSRAGLDAVKKKKSPSRESNSGLENNLQIYIKESVCNDIDWIQLAEVGSNSGLLWTWICTFSFHKSG